MDDFRKHFEALYKPVVGFLYYRCGDIALAEDIAQDVFLKLWEKRGELKHETIKPLVYTIAANLLKNQFKHQKVILSFALKNAGEEHAGSADHDILTEEFKSHLEQVISSIPEKPRIVFLMNRLENLTYQVIALRLGLSQKAIEKRMAEALAVIRDKLKVKI